MTDQIVRRADRADLPARDDRDPIRDRLHVGEDVRREEHRLAALAQLEDQVAHLLAADRIEAAHRLVEHDQIGVVHERLGQASPLHHALRELLEVLGARAIEADPRDQLVGAALARGGVDAEQPAREVAELADGQVVVEVRLLGQEPEALARGAAGHGLAEDLGGAAGRGDEAHEDADRRGLAGAVGTQEAEDLAAPDKDVDPAQGYDLAPAKRRSIGLLEVLDLDDRGLVTHACGQDIASAVGEGSAAAANRRRLAAGRGGDVEALVAGLAAHEAGRPARPRVGPAAVRTDDRRHGVRRCDAEADGSEHRSSVGARVRGVKRAGGNPSKPLRVGHNPGRSLLSGPRSRRAPRSRHR